MNAVLKRNCLSLFLITLLLQNGPAAPAKEDGPIDVTGREHGINSLIFNDIINDYHGAVWSCTQSLEVDVRRFVPADDGTSMQPRYINLFQKMLQLRAFVHQAKDLTFNDEQPVDLKKIDSILTKADLWYPATDDQITTVMSKMGDKALQDMVTLLAAPPFDHVDEPFHFEELQFPMRPNSTPEQQKAYLNDIWNTSIWSPYLNTLGYSDAIVINADPDHPIPPEVFRNSNFEAVIHAMLCLRAFVCQNKDVSLTDEQRQKFGIIDAFLRKHDLWYTKNLYVNRPLTLPPDGMISPLKDPVIAVAKSTSDEDLNALMTQLQTPILIGQDAPVPESNGLADDRIRAQRLGNYWSNFQYRLKEISVPLGAGEVRFKDSTMRRRYVDLFRSMAQLRAFVHQISPLKLTDEQSKRVALIDLILKQHNIWRQETWYPEPIRSVVQTMGEAGLNEMIDQLKAP